jgi:nitrate reductase assembly molybdenum cofactor insertion protein NarJ
MSDRSHYRLIASLFEYPDAQFPEKVTAIRNLLNTSYPSAAKKLDQFIDHLPVHDLLLMQELFTRSFDVQAIATLDLGYVLFGDDYKRGEMLSNLNREHLEAGNDCGTELADHLPNILRLMSLLRDEELITDLAYAIIAPALMEMLGEFDPDRLQKKNESYEKHYKTLIETPAVKDEAVTLYKFALQSLYEVLKKDFSLIEEMPLKRDVSDFLISVVEENEIEQGAEAQ